MVCVCVCVCVCARGGGGESGGGGLTEKIQILIIQMSREKLIALLYRCLVHYSVFISNVVIFSNISI